jgi:hypothetical protein
LFVIESISNDLKPFMFFTSLRRNLCGWLALFIVLGGAGCARPPFSQHITTTAKPWTRLDFNNDPDRFQFVVVSDRTGGVRPGVFEEATRKINLLQPEFVMSVGDLIMGNTTNRVEIAAEWLRLLACI